MKIQLLFRKGMKVLLSLIVFSFVLLLLTQQSNAQTITGNTQGTNNGFFYSFWNNNSGGSASMTLGSAGNYSTTWSSVGNFTAGKGWATGSANRVVCFSGNFNGGSNGFLALYGWTKNALIEYYVCENHGSWTPPGNTSDIVKKGTFTSDGGTYTIYTATRTNQPSIIGTATFQQYWSVRTETRTSGTITFANHVAAWKNAGMNMGTTWDYQIMETEGYQSSGSSNITVSECTSCATTAPTVTSPVTYCQNATATALTATGTALKWYTVATGGTALTSTPTPSTTATGTTNYYVSQTVSGCEGPRALIAVTVNAPPGAPTVTSSVAYCQNAPPTALTATGTALKWYTVATGGTALTSTPTPSTSATGTTNYYVSQTTNGCESSRALIAVTVSAPPNAPTVTTPVTYCQNAAATALTATGTALKWYTVATGGTALTSTPTPSTSTTGTTNYYVSQTTSGCESSRALLAVTINAAPSAPTVTTPVTYCQNAAATALTANGSSLTWYTVATGGTALTSTPTPSTSTTGTTNYYVSQTTSGCESARALLAVTVNAAPNAPTVTTPVTYCQNAAATALTATGTALKWYTVATGGTALASTPTPSTSATGTTNYYVSQTTTGCESSRALLAVTVNAIPSAPTVTTPVTYCQNGAATALTATGTALKWYTVATGGTALASTPTPTTSTTGTTNYYVSQTTTGCESSRALLAVTVNAAPNAPTVTTPVTYCQNAAAAALTANGSSLKWYTVATGGTALTSIPTPTTSTTGTTNYYVSQTTTGCESTRALLAVTINAAPNAPTVTTPVTYCQNAAATALTANGSSLKWYTVATGGTALASTPTPSTSTTGTTNYYVSQTTTGCESGRALLAVTVNAVPNAPTVTLPVTYCQNAAATALTANGSSLAWYTVATGGTALASTPTPSTSATGTTNYYVSQTTTGCESGRALLAVTVNALPNASITVNGNTTIVQGQTVTLNAATGTGLSYKWYNGDTEVSAESSYEASTAGNYTVVVTNSSGCTSTSAVTTISVTPNQPSVITITSIADNASVQAPVTISATVSDPDGAIALVEFLDGNTVIGSTTSEPYSFNWTNPSTGSHTISVRATDVYGGVTTSAPITITTGLTTGIQSMMNNIDAKVYPVPARDEVIIETGLDLTNAIFRITNALGQEVLLPINVEGNNAKLNVGGLPEGAYLLLIRQDSNILSKKIIKTN